MDILCPKCAEPWDNDCFHDVAEENGDGTTYTMVMRDFRSRGCAAMESAYGPVSCNPNTRGSFRAQVSDAMFDLLGDDTDGHASMMEDFEYFGMLGE